MLRILNFRSFPISGFEVRDAQPVYFFTWEVESTDSRLLLYSSQSLVVKVVKSSDIKTLFWEHSPALQLHNFSIIANRSPVTLAVTPPAPSSQPAGTISLLSVFKNLTFSDILNNWDRILFVLLYLS